jgi:putative flippase GtrA
VTPPTALSENAPARTIEHPEVPARSFPKAAQTWLARALSKPQNWVQLVKFGLVGTSGFVVNTAVYTVCLRVLGVHYLLSAVAAFGVAVSNNFLWNRLWTFRDRRAHHPALQGARFLLVSVSALAPNLLLLHLFVQSGADKVAAQVLAVCLVTPISFVGNKLWSFGRR